MAIHIKGIAHSDLQIRRARQSDAAEIARLFLVSSDGLAAYIWTRDKAPDTDLLEHGAARYARSETAFSYQNCRVATVDAQPVGMLHAFRMPASERPETDPVLRPYAELEIPGSFYISGVAVHEKWRGRGIGSSLLDAAERETRVIGATATSLICFAANTAAMRLYLARNYREVDRRPLVPHPTLRYTEGDAVLLARASSLPAA